MDLQKMFEDMVDRCAYRIEEGDYMGDDGLMYCGNCKGKKETKIINPFTKQPQIVGCACACQVAKNKPNS